MQFVTEFKFSQITKYYRYIYTAVITICWRLGNMLQWTFLRYMTKRRTTACRMPVNTENVKIKIRRVSCNSEKINTMTYTVVLIIDRLTTVLCKHFWNKRFLLEFFRNVNIIWQTPPTTDRRSTNICNKTISILILVYIWTLLEIIFSIFTIQ